MGIGYNPSIMTDGLVLCLDTANIKSYPSSGTSWTDIKSSRSLTIYNAPTYTSDKSFDFDKTGDYAGFVDRHTDLEFQPNTPYSVFVLMKSKTFQAGAIVANMSTVTTLVPGWDLYQHSSTVMAMHLISNWGATPKNAIKVGVDYNFTENLDKWVYVGFTYDGTTPTTTETSLSSVNFYVNGALSSTNKTLLSGGDSFAAPNTTISYEIEQRFRVATRYGTGGGLTSDTSPNIQIVHVYNKKLSASEVMQNFSAIRGRFGI